MQAEESTLIREFLRTLNKRSQVQESSESLFEGNNPFSENHQLDVSMQLLNCFCFPL